MQPPKLSAPLCPHPVPLSASGWLLLLLLLGSNSSSPTLPSQTSLHIQIKIPNFRVQLKTRPLRNLVWSSTLPGFSLFLYLLIHTVYPNVLQTLPSLLFRASHKWLPEPSASTWKVLKWQRWYSINTFMTHVSPDSAVSAWQLRNQQLLAAPASSNEMFLFHNFSAPSLSIFYSVSHWACTWAKAGT